MLNKARFSRVLFVTVLCFSAAGVFAQQSASPAQPPSNQIVLDVVVTPKSGPPVPDLQQQDFTLLDNKSPQPITSFKAVPGREAPAEIIIVIDAVNTGYRTLSIERTQLGKFLRAEGGHLAYPIALTVFTDKGIQVLGNFSSEGNALGDTLDHSEIGLRDLTRAAGFYGAEERLQLSLRVFGQLAESESRRPGRKIMLWVSPGWPLLSGPRVELDSKQQAQIFSDIVRLSTQLQSAGVTVYNVNPLGSNEALLRTSNYKNFLKGVSKPNQVLLGNLGLQVFATQSGGLVLDLNNDVASLLQQCISDIAPYYEISFAAPAAERPDEYHHLEIRIDKPGLTARTRQGYYAQPQPAPRN
jgi:VWFA-related protein